MLASLITPSWSIDLLENWAALCTGTDGGMRSSLMDVRVERMEAGFVGDPCNERLEGDDEDDASVCSKLDG